MDLMWGMAIGLTLGSAIGFLTCAILAAGKRADEMAEMMRMIREEK